MNIRKWLQKPYPLIERPVHKLLLAFGFGVFVFIFLIVYQPFGASEVLKDKALFLSGFGLSVFLSLVFIYFISPILFKSFFKSEYWTVKREIILVVSCFIIIAIFNYIYNSTVGKDIAVQRSLLSFIGVTVSIGFFPLMGLVFLTEKYLNTKNRVQAGALSEKIQPSINHSEHDLLIKITSENIKEAPLEINVDEFIYATSDNNYTTIFYVKDNEIRRNLLRLSIKNLEKQLSAFNSIIRCHRSYIVNKQKIRSINGNARSLMVQLDLVDKKIPISRSFPKEKLL